MKYYCMEVIQLVSTCMEHVSDKFSREERQERKILIQLALEEKERKAYGMDVPTLCTFLRTMFPVSTEWNTGGTGDMYG